ncbi:pilus assembly PilX family protein [Shewanella sp. 125m-7]
MQKQKGIVLFFSLIVLLIMTVIGVALAVNSTQSIRMAGAGSERVEAVAVARGAQDRVIANNSGTNLALIRTVTTIADGTFDVTNTLTPLSDGDVDCMRMLHPNQAGMIDCVPMEISSEATFGRNDMGRLTLVTGIEQEVLGGTGN